MTSLDSKTCGPALESALDTMNAPALRAFVRSFASGLEEPMRIRLAREALAYARQLDRTWVFPPSEEQSKAEEIEAFMATAESLGRAYPDEIDEFLQEGSDAFLTGNFEAARCIFRGVLGSLASRDIDFGQEELLDEVFETDLQTCISQYLVSVYLTLPPRDRATAIRAVIRQLRPIGFFTDPVNRLEQTALEPLPDFENFLFQWSALLEQEIESKPQERYANLQSQKVWLRNTVFRLEHLDGLARLARTFKSDKDLRIWCNAVCETKDWGATRKAYEEAFELSGGTERAHFLDGVAFAAQKLKASDVGDLLEACWRHTPRFDRLIRWLDWCSAVEDTTEYANEALERVPTQATRQRAFLHLVRGEFEKAGRLCAKAPGMGWWDEEHPGHIVSSFFIALLSGGDLPDTLFETMDPQRKHIYADSIKFYTPDPNTFLGDIRYIRDLDESVRAHMTEVLQKTAEKRLKEVTHHKSRKSYAHAAMLAVECALVDSDSSHGHAWLKGQIKTYRRFSALQREFREAKANLYT